MIGIYKIKNLINGKEYIGQSVHIDRRWSEHKRCSIDKPLYQDMKLYGIDNFDFLVLEECEIESLSEREHYYIEKYDTITPHGYNISFYTDSNTTNFLSYDYDTYLEIVELLVSEKSLTLTDIAERYGLSLSTISRINSGDIHILKYEYPLRVTIEEKISLCHCGEKISPNAKECVKCYNLNRRKVDRPSREELKQLIRTIPFTTIAKEFGISDNAIRKWCKSEDLPFSSKEIKSYSDEEWNLI